MYTYLPVDITCSKKRTVSLKQSSRKTVSFEEKIVSKDKYPHIFLHQIGAIVSMNSPLCKYFAMCMKKRLRTAYGIQCGMFSFETVLNAQRKDFHSSVTTTKTLSNLDLNLKQRILVVDVRFENWGISLPRVIFSDITQF